MGMTGRIAALWGEANNKYMMSQRRASDVAGGFGALSKALRMMLQSAVLAVGAWLVIHQEATAGIIIAGSILSARALGAGRSGYRQLEEVLSPPGKAGSRLTKLLALLPAQTAPMALRRLARA